MGATQKKGVSEEVEVETLTEVKASPNPRNEQIEAIAAANAERMHEELEAAGLESVIPIIDDPVITDDRLIGEDELSHLRVKTKVDGVETELPVTEVIRGYQKDGAASKRLEEASAKQRELDAREADLAARELALSNINVPQLSHDQDAAIAETLDAIYEGDQDRAKQALGKLLNGRLQATQAVAATAPALDVGQITEAVKGQLAYEQDMDAFGKNFKDVVSDPILANVADAYLAEELKQDGITLSKALDNAGNKTRAWLKEKSSQVSGNTLLDPKLDRKRELDNPPSANNRQLSDQQPTEENPSDVIRQMRLSRGLPV